MFGLFVFFYASIHMLSYVGLDYRFDFEPLINDVLKKKFVFIGFSAWLLLIPLAITSSDKMAKLLKQNWKKLHRLNLCNFNFWSFTLYLAIKNYIF